ncbi:hypothetical protein EDM53_01615 [Rickettsiales endosymbiont of Peranema trichophorum]|uniref:single-stranded DNA-binding protein n=1 Tax=Rickettsiales endosymbiont of Peranema trichophorum TaxID=2486577 RepID=UPI0010237A5C|nr:single-stranded DNA-binding protein [Rickettsiales endosymbiont of Peranema trichophorum]RZI47506.1 hypothetical protein EDM53_01615 [Rickettsiales endosymbiont of Peranema trichophorum]
MNKSKNIVELIGQLSKEVKGLKTKEGKDFAIITVTVPNDKRTELIDVFIWNQETIDFATKYLEVGNTVSIKGSLSKTDKGLFVRCHQLEDLGIKESAESEEQKQETTETT